MDLTYRTRSEVAQDARARSLAEWFGTRRWRVRTEDTSPRPVRHGSSSVSYDHGEFWIEGEHVFQTPLGYKGRHGFLIQEIDPASGADLPGAPVCFGHAVLTKAQERFSCFPAGLPRERRNPPAK